MGLSAPLNPNPKKALEAEIEAARVQEKAESLAAVLTSNPGLR